MTRKDDDMLARFFIAEALLAELVARHPQRNDVIAGFDAFASQQAAMQAAQGLSPDFRAAFRDAHANLLRLVTAKPPIPPSP